MIPVPTPDGTSSPVSTDGFSSPVSTDSPSTPAARQPLSNLTSGHVQTPSTPTFRQTPLTKTSAARPSPATLEKRRNNSGHCTQFNEKWKENRPWLICREEISPDGFTFQTMYCKICQKWDTKGARGSKVWNTVGCVSTRAETIQLHETSSMHMDAMNCELHSQPSLPELVDNVNQKEFAALIDSQKVLYFLIKHNLPHTTLFKPFIDLCIELGATNLPYLNKGKNATYTGHQVVNEFLQCQADVVEEELDKISKSDGFGVMLDEYTDVSARKHLALVGRYLDEGVSKLAFLQDIQVANGTADTVYGSMKSFLNEKPDITMSKLTSFASDGPSVMLGKKNGVVTQLKRDNPAVVTMHCMNHRLQLAVSKSFKSVKTIENTDELLSGLFKYYHYSTVKTQSLKSIQTILRDMGELDTKNNLTMKKAVHTRWLSHEKSLQTVRKLYNPILRDLENAAAEGRDKTIRDGCGIPPSSLLKMMKNYRNLFFIHMLCDVCATVGSLTRLFEREDVDLSIIEPKLQATVAVLEKMKKHPGPYLSKVNAIAKDLQIQVIDDMKQINDNKDDFLNNLVENIEGRLENPELVTRLAALNLTQANKDTLSFYGDMEVCQLAEHFGLDEEETQRQWTEIKELFEKEVDKCTARHLLQTLSKKRLTLGNVFPEVVKLLSIAETLIISTSAVERVFSRVQLIVTTHRNRLNVKTTNNLLMVGINTNCVSDIDLKKVVRKFLSKSKRRIC